MMPDGRVRLKTSKPYNLRPTTVRKQPVNEILCPIWWSGYYETAS
jgi:hypothetical protein